MADNIQVRDATGSPITMRTTDLSGVNIPHSRRADDLVVTGPAAQSVLNTDLITGTVNGWYDAIAFQSGTVQIIAGAGISAGAITIEQTNDSTLATTGAVVNFQEPASLSAGAQNGAVTIAASTQRIFNFPITARYVRVRISTAFVGGTVQAVTVLSQEPYAAPMIQVAGSVSATNTPTSNIFYNESVTAQAAAATLTGTSRDVAVAAATAHRYSAFNAFAFADQAGTMRIECSNDNTTWRRMTTDQAVAANTPVILSVPVMTRYHRVVYINGATLQTAFMLNTSYTAA
jgi:hypothetical protein